MSARDFADALADVMRPRVIEAQRYLDEHLDLEQLGMPIEIARHALDREAIQTAPLRAIRAWDKDGKGKGLLALHGALNNGKTHAAALWARARRNAGRRVVWISAPSLLSFEALDRALSRAAKAHAVVVDDVGPGLGGTDGFRTKLAAWVQERGHLKTVLTANANTAQLESYLGARLVSRLKQAGELVAFDRDANLRERDHEELDDAGRGRRWQAARWLVWRFGCEPDDRVEGRRVVRGYRVGDDLADARLPLEQLESLAMRFGHALETIADRTAEIEAEAEAVRGMLRGWNPPELGALTGKMSEIIELADEDLRRAERARKLATSVGSPKTFELAPGPDMTRSELVALGFRVDPLGPGFVVRRRIDPKSRKATTLSPVLPTAPDGWSYADRLCGL